jgi:hypothetical protein
MDVLIQQIALASPLDKAVAVTVGGLLGVFATLAVFYVIILVSNEIAGHRKA